jgi:hypothetical protein
VESAKTEVIKASVMQKKSGHSSSKIGHHSSCFDAVAKSSKKTVADALKSMHV